jgi:hypothetical protein
LSPAAEMEGTPGLSSGSGQPVGDNESVPGMGPQFLRDEQEDGSWLSSHKYMVVAIMIAVIIIVALLLAR